MSNYEVALVDVLTFEADRAPDILRLLFSVPLGLENELNASRVPDSLRKAFQDNKEPLPEEDDLIDIVEVGREWQIDAGPSPFVVRKADESLEIYTSSESIFSGGAVTVTSYPPFGDQCSTVTRAGSANLSLVEFAKLVAQLSTTSPAPEAFGKTTICLVEAKNDSGDDIAANSVRHQSIARQLLTELNPDPHIFLSGGELPEATVSLWKGPEPQWLVLIGNDLDVLKDWAFGLLVHSESEWHVSEKRRKDYEDSLRKEIKAAAKEMDDVTEKALKRLDASDPSSQDEALALSKTALQIYLSLTKHIEKAKRGESVMWIKPRQFGGVRGADKWVSRSCCAQCASA